MRELRREVEDRRLERIGRALRHQGAGEGSAAPPAARVTRNCQQAGVSGRSHVAVASTFAKPYQLFTGWDLRRTLALLQPVYGLMKGIPTEHPLASTYWRKRTPPPAAMDPDRDGCGLLWASPVAPADGHHARELTALASDFMLDRGFEPMISLTMITDRSLACVVSIAFDRDVPGEDERALDCYHELMRRLASGGYILTGWVCRRWPVGCPALIRTCCGI